MADPRYGVGFLKIGQNNESFLIDDVAITYSATQNGGSSSVGLAVTMSAAQTISTVADGEAVIGKLLKVEPDGVATVQVKGGMTLPAGSSASLTRGKMIVGDLLVAAEGYIREVNTAVAAELGVARGSIHNGGTTTAVVVML